MGNIQWIFVVALMFAGNAQAELYRSIDKDGKVHYGDAPLQGSEDVATVNVDKTPISEEMLSYETQHAMQNFPVTMYSFPECGTPCQQARDFLKKRGIPFSEKTMVTPEEIAKFRKDSNEGMIPAITIGKEWHNGFQADQWKAALDLAGYPKFAPYRPKPAVPPAQPAQ